MLDKKKGKNLNINDKGMEWFRNGLSGVLKGTIPVNNIRATYKGKGEWVKISFWIQAKRIDKEEEKKDGNSKAKGTGS